MSTHEAMLGISKRDLLFSFAKKGSRNKKLPQPRQTGPNHSPTQPKRPEKGGNRLTRREFISLAAAGTVGTAGILVGILQPWNRSIPQPETSQPETLESLVVQAKKMEDEYKNADISDKEIRNQYTKLLADIFVRYYPVGISKEQLLSSVVFTDSKEAFEGIFINTMQTPNLPTQYLKNQANKTSAFTIDSKTYINATNEIFQKQKTASSPNFPKDWNHLKSLRLTLFHEFSHVITQPTEDTTIFSVVDQRNDIRDKKVDGFLIKGLNSKGDFVGLYDSIDEACIELLSKYINTDLFHSFLSDYSSDNQGNVTAIMIRLEKLVSSASVDRLELINLHKSSNLRGFLLLLSERYGINPQRITEKDRIAFGFSIFEALVQNNQTILQDYMNSAKRFTK